MFSAAIDLATKFTFPVIISQKTVAGVCSSSVAAFVVINRDGWIVTAGHVLQHWREAKESADRQRAREDAEKVVRADATLNDKDRRDKLRAIGRPKPTEIDRASSLWSTFAGNPQPVFMAILDGADLGVARLAPWDPSWVTTYPKFKDPAKDFAPGRSLCKLGFPFHAITPTYDAPADSFLLPQGALPVPLFPLDGIFTRTALIDVQNDPTPDIPKMWVETSTPGLRGQSGGPTFDVDGVLWAIQSQTSHLPLGFNSTIPAQYLHVGLGVHPATIFAVLKKLGVQFDIA